MFLAPALYAVHALLTGASLVIANLIGIKHGFGFSAGLIDYVLSFGIATKPFLLIPIGLAYAAVYFALFSAIIKIFNLQTPGREAEEAPDESSGGASVSESLQEKACGICGALGGRGNVAAFDACITRLRLKVKNESLIDDKALKALGAHGIVRLGGGSLQVVIGTQAELICEHMKALKPSVTVLSPFTGRAVPVQDVPDQVFSQKMMGDGLAVEPVTGEAVAPVSGELVSLFPTGHAFGIRTPDGLEVLVHIGLNTVEMKGEGFNTHKVQGDFVKAGDRIVSFDLDLCKQKAHSVISPVVVTNMEAVVSLSVIAAGDVTAGKSALFNALLTD